MGRQFRVEGGDYQLDPTRFRDRVPEPADNKDADSHLAAAYAAQAEHDLHVSQIDRAGKQKPYQNIEDVCDDPGKTAPSKSQHATRDDVFMKG